MSQEFQSTAHSGVGSHILLDHSVQAVCSLCQKILSHDNEAAGDLETIGICGDCKFLFSEDLDTPSRESRRRRLPRRRRTRYSSSESSENTFSQQFSQVINLVRQNESTISAYEDLPVEGDPTGRLLQHPSSRTTPMGSRRCRRVLIPSDTKSEDSDNVDSLFADSESNVSFGWHKAFQGDSDAISCSTYGGDSDASVDLHGFLDSEMFTQPIEGGEFDSDTDIDPMHVGLNNWNSDDLGSEGEAEDEEGDGEWEEVHAEEDMIPPTDARSHIRNFSYSSRSGQMGRSSESDDTMHWENREGNQTYTHNIFANSEQAWMADVGESTNYLDARVLEEFLQHLVEDDNSRLGVPPREVSFVNSLPRVIINEEHEKQLDGLACAICKDMLAIGVEVNQLPCKHLYHPSCILPWLRSRNSCPLCRYELPIDDKDYEEGKCNTTSRVEISTHHLNVTEDSFSSSSSDRAEEELEFNEGRLEQRGLQDVEPEANSSRKQSGRRRWFFLAAAPVVGLVGIVLVLWLGNLGTERRGFSTALWPLPQQSQQNLQINGSLSNGRENRSRRWWSLF
ncbi:uncharacterized protein LOC133777414 [Humulus lupulus]|uniref:uncharacterized protein LOC133777414 n=1 Tax=Humulus lupulus TaxID=3486 RepID=UPI002B40A23A|nr:uncharacterized protein LOC133777414 [Humulus lupulus]XP_062072966.1 uncharacterized protein LOC133777414 [Humulus lupulus]